MTHSSVDVELQDVRKKKIHPVVDWLDANTTDLLNEIKEQDFWKIVISSGTDPRLVARLMQEVYLEIVGYQPHVIEAAIASIGQFPRSMKPRLVKAMLAHQGDEFDHGEMALRDFVGLGGHQSEARKKRMSREAAISLALGESAQVAAAASNNAGAGPLGKREADVARLVADGLSNKQIGARLLISERTVETHVRSILNKLGLNSRAQVAVWVTQHDLLKASRSSH